MEVVALAATKSTPPEPLPLHIPAEPPPSTFSFPPVSTADARGRLVVGGDLEPGTLLAAYRAGIFPMRQGNGELAWWSPDPRGIITPDRLRVSASLRRSRRRFVTTVDTAFEAVISACAERGDDEYLWITAEVRQAYVRLHQLGWAHSVEAWTMATDEEPSMLVGGLYGVAVGGLFCGESMFHRRTDASKVAFVTLVELLRDDGRNDEDRLIDAQWLTPHLASLGAVEVHREEYLTRLERALELPLPVAFAAFPSGIAPAP
jgi:leucyl/phenylalanyl-tRNA--protein transferase